MEQLTKCPDCGVSPGEPHLDNCDVEICSVCGGRTLMCGGCNGEHDIAFARWTGLWPGHAEATALGINLYTFYNLGYNRIFFIKPKID